MSWNIETKDDLLEMAWVIISNSSDWCKIDCLNEPDEWVDAAEEFRNHYFRMCPPNEADMAQERLK